MDHSLLRSWLKLPPGPWPPDHYALLGLQPDACDPATVEASVLARMDRLRMHQLLHPELVTEGMNRLAQALICLTDPGTRTSYDAERRVSKPDAPPPFTVVESPDEDGPPPDANPTLEIPFAPGLAPPEPGPPADFAAALPAPYEVVPDEVVAPAELPAPYEVVPDEVVVPAERPPSPRAVPRPVAGWQPRSRRELFARLATLRRLLAAWRKLRPVLADAREPLDRPAGVLAMLEAVEELRPLLAQLRVALANSDHSGALAAALVSQRFVLPTFRTLLPEQRRKLSLDWRRAELALAREHDRLREMVRAGRPLRRGGRRASQVARWVARTPEVVLLVLVVASAVVALLRSHHVP